MTTNTYPNTYSANGTLPAASTYVALSDGYAAPAERPGGVDQLQYWVGAGITAVIAALTGLIGLIVAHGILGVPVLIESGSALSPVNVSAYGLAAAGLALLAAGLFAAMLRVAPRPVTYYSWLVGLVTVLAVLLPFTTTASLHSQIALGLINLAVGLVVAVSIPLAASNAVRH